MFSMAMGPAPFFFPHYLGSRLIFRNPMLFTRAGVQDATTGRGPTTYQPQEYKIRAGENLIFLHWTGDPVAKINEKSLQGWANFRLAVAVPRPGAGKQGC